MNQVYVVFWSCNAVLGLLHEGMDDKYNVIRLMAVHNAISIAGIRHSNFNNGRAMKAPHRLRIHRQTTRQRNFEGRMGAFFDLHGKRLKVL